MQPTDIFSPEFEHDPYRYYEMMRNEHPLFFHEGLASYIVSRHEDVDKLLKSLAASTRAYAWQVEPVHGRTVLQMEGKEHATHRSLVTPLLRGRQLAEKVLPMVHRNAERIIGTIREEREVDFVEWFSERYPLDVLTDIFDLPRSDHAVFYRWYRAITEFATNVTKDPEIHATGLRVRQEMGDYMFPMIRRRREAPGEDMLSWLANAEIDGVRMSDEDIRAFFSILLTAGAETTAKSLATMLKNLLVHPAQLAAIRNDRSLTPAAIAETLRHTSPGQMLFRIMDQDFEVSGGTLPAEAQVLILIGSANRDPRRFEAPERFDIFRKDLDVERAFLGSSSSMAFGTGRHFCLGSMLAKAEMQVALEQLLDATSDIQIVGEVPTERGKFMRSIATLRLRLTPAARPQA